ncbi:MAG: type IV pilus twitching motility protein PilT [Campylobacter sp.]|uniref:type IV pilus twitching motility protein PilT n=1 Tax=Campylobacter sp. TaxID=205 RepID=UPI003F9F029C
MKPLRFTSVNEEDVKDYEPIGSSIKFDSQDDVLESIIKLNASILKSEIEHGRNKRSHEEQGVVPLKADDAVREEAAAQPESKFEEIGGFDDLPKLKPIDDELAKDEEQEEPGKIDKFDAFSESTELESKRQELSENLQAINEALNEIDALDEMPAQEDENDEEAIFVAWKEPQIEKDTQEISEFDQDGEKSDVSCFERLQETVVMKQISNEKDQLLDFLRDEFASVELDGDEEEATDKFCASQSDQDKFDTEEDENLESKFDSIKNEFDIVKNEINSDKAQSNLNADFWDVPQSKELEDKGFLKIDEYADSSVLEEQISELNLTQTQEETSKGVDQVQTIGDTQESRANTAKEPEARPVRRRDRAALLAELGIGMEDETFGTPIRTTVPQSDEENEKKAEMKVILDGYLTKLIELGGSDLHVKSNKAIRGRFNGEIFTMGDQILDYDSSVILAKEILGANYYNLMKKKSVDFTYKLNDDYRFRSNVFLQMDGVSFVFRTIPTKIPTMSELLLPPVIEKLCNKVNRGIVLVTGPTGSGKTTTLASMINHLNHTKNYHIVTIEDPIEFIYSDDKSVINQRGIGQDVDSFADALRASLREDPDVIFVGEMRDLETVRTAINAAETGHLVLATLHTLDAKETIGRVINMFPKEEQNRIRMTFASVAEAIISQRLVVTTGNKRRVACEIMIKNIRIRDMILEDRDSEIYDAIEQSRNTYQMQTFEQHLLDMYTSGIITKEEALKSAGRRENLDIKIKSADLAKKRAMLASIEEDAALLKEFQSDVIALKDIK